MTPNLSHFKGAMNLLFNNPSIDQKESIKAILSAYNTNTDAEDKDIQTINIYLQNNQK